MSSSRERAYLMGITVRCLGSGDAFGSGGRLQACYCVESESTHFLVDCGATVMPAMTRFGVRPETIDIVLVSHLHGDHFGGLPFLIREAQIELTRTSPLIVAGPKGIEQYVYTALEALFPGAAEEELPFELSFVELPAGRSVAVGPATVTSHNARHKERTNPLALRIEIENKIIAYSGDTEWTDSLMDIAGHADLFICEAYTFIGTRRGHLGYRDLMRHIRELTCKQMLLTHMSEDMLSHLSNVGIETAEDGKKWVLT